MSSFFLTICVFILISSVSAQEPERKLYIAYMGYLPEGEYSPSLHHSQIIQQVIHPSYASKSLIRSYGRSFNGFAAHLSEEEKHKLSRTPGVVSVFPSQKLLPQTTRSWDFMGLDRNTERRHFVESDTIIGVIDTGIWPESASFTDEGYGPIPAKWKGTCDGGEDFACNRKIIGARTFSIESKDPSARDTDGHGTHVASIIAGNHVRHASYYGLASGIARGGVPSARLAIYKVCYTYCAGIDILSAFDQAIADGVDMISISIGGQEQLELAFDPIAIGAFHAIEKDILTINAAGNNGPGLFSIPSYAPWLLTVAASDIDRKIINKLLLGKDTILVGYGINAFPSSAEALPLVYGKDLTINCSDNDARYCLDQCLESSLVEQKIVLCDKFPNLEAVNKSGAIGCIYPSLNDLSLVRPCPTIALNRTDFNLVKIFKNSTIQSNVEIFKSEVINNPDAPSVAFFSSRGPGRFMPDIIKPDVVAPGVEILAAYSPLGSPSEIAWDKNSVKFNILSGTSMACPHVTAAAAFVKSFHPKWSPSAIKSALMTTALEFNASLYPDAEFAYGSGHIDPIKATDPGLVYQTSVEQYQNIRCAIPLNTSCPVKLSHTEINYPSMAVLVEAGVPFVVTFPRAMLNVGQANSTYIASIEGDPSDLHYSVEPNTLHFMAMNHEKNFSLTVRGDKMEPQTIKHVSLVWTDGIHRVRSPVVIFSTSYGEITPTPTPEIAPTPSSPIVIDTTSDGERASRFHTFMFIYLLTIILCYDRHNYVFIIFTIIKM